MDRGRGRDERLKQVFLIMTVDKNGRKKIEKLDRHSVPEKILLFFGIFQIMIVWFCTCDYLFACVQHYVLCNLSWSNFLYLKLTGQICEFELVALECVV